MKIVTIQKFQCELCDTLYDLRETALKCESRVLVASLYMFRDFCRRAADPVAAATEVLSVWRASQDKAFERELAELKELKDDRIGAALAGKVDVEALKAQREKHYAHIAAKITEHVSK